jgi:hypothetical protein
MEPEATRRLLFERRSAIRFPSSLQAVCRTGGGKTGVGWPAQVRNVSAKGAGLVLARPFSPGTQLRVHFLTDRDQPYIALVRVVHCNSETSGCYHGCAFLRQLNVEEVEALVK